MRRLLITLTALLLAGPAHAAAPPPQWLPQDSWPGGKQHDPRLEQTVKLWATAVPAADLFASITNQTGVPLAFSPPDDDNARLCLNVYLNPKEPPTLRDLLVQIGWVMDCAWAVEGEGEGRRYVLLHTSLGADLIQSHRKLMRQAEQSWTEEWNRYEQEMRRRGIQKLGDLRAALALARDDAIRRYRGVDDNLLVVLLDPVQKLCAEYLVDLPKAEREQLEKGYGSQQTWSELAEAQRALLRQAMELDMRSPTFHRQPSSTRPADLPDDAPLVARAYPTQNGFAVMVELPSEEEDEPLSSSGAPPPPRLPTLNAHLNLMEGGREEDGLTFASIRVQRLLGEIATEEEAQRLMREADGQWYAAREQRQLARQLAAQRPVLQPETAAALSALALPAQADGSYSLWQLQEAVAALSGRHVVSDNFWQPVRGFGGPLGLLRSQGRAEPSALGLLQWACHAKLERSQILWRGQPFDPFASGSEWGDAGRFLRFRSRDRDIMRAGFLPAAAVRLLDSWADAALPTDAGRPKEPITVSLDLRPYLQLLASLTPVQRDWGLVLSYGDPSTTANACRQTFRGRLAFFQAKNLRYAHLLGLLSDDLWRQLNAEGIRWGEQFTLQSSEDQIALHGTWAEEERAGDVFRLRDPSPELAKKLTRVSDAASWRVLEVQRNGETQEVGLLPRQVTVPVQMPEHLVSPPPEYAP